VEVTVSVDEVVVLGIVVELEVVVVDSASESTATTWPVGRLLEPESEKNRKFTAAIPITPITKIIALLQSSSFFWGSANL